MTTRNRTPLVVAIVLVVVAIVAIAAVRARGRDDDDAAPERNRRDGATATTIALPDELVGEIRPVTVEGSALPPLAGIRRRRCRRAHRSGAHRRELRRVGGHDGVGGWAGDGRLPRPLVSALQRRDPETDRARGGRALPRRLEDRRRQHGRGPGPTELPAVGVDRRQGLAVAGDGRRRTTSRTDPSSAPRRSASTRFPFITVVGADGTVLGRWSGESEPDDFIAKLDAALADVRRRPAQGR